GTPLCIVVELQADESELMRRMLDRARKEGRTDDNPMTIQQRMDVYKRQTAPLLDYYRQQGKLLSVDAMGRPDEVFERICRGVDQRRSQIATP
ncbi:MAG: nucleoside monophosphate kinase, partial [Dongiaceae bacterium]